MVDMYVLTRPECKESETGLLESVGNSLARETESFPKPGSGVECTETVTYILGRVVAERGDVPGRYVKIKDAAENIGDISGRYVKLRDAAEKMGIWVKFGHDENLNVVRTEYEGCNEDSGEPLKTTCKTRHFFDVEGYVCRPEKLLDNMDMLKDLTDVLAAVESNGRAKIVYGRLDEFLKYNPASGNVVTVFEFDKPEIYSELGKLVDDKLAEKKHQIETSLDGRIFGSRYRNWKINRAERKSSDVRDKIDTLKTKFLSKPSLHV